MRKRGNNALQTECNNDGNWNNQKIYAYMARMYDNDESPSKYFGDYLQLINCILDSKVMCHMTPKVSDFIPGSLKNTDKNI